jgi:pilus assembly protein TadC
MNSTMDVVLLVAALVTLGLFLGMRRSGVDMSGTGTQSRDFKVPGFFGRNARQAGFDPKTFLPIFWILKVILAALVPLGLNEIAADRFEGFPNWALVAGGILGFFLPDLWLLGVRRERQRTIAWGLPYFLDLVVAFLRSGLGLEEAFRRAGREGFRPDHPLAQEVALVAHELDLGKDRAAAFRALAERTGVQGMRGVAAALESGLRLGASVEATLRGQAEVLRARRREDTLRKVQLAAVKALVPVILCGFPLFIVIVFFPALTEVMRTFGAIAGAP